MKAHRFLSATALGVLLISCGNTADQNFIGAAGRGDVKAANKYLENGMDVNKKEASSGWTALAMAAARGKKDMVILLLNAGADMNISSGGLVPLSIAIENGHADIVTILIEKGANVNAAPSGVSPLDMAAREGRVELVKLLIAKGASLESFGATALLRAEEKGHSDVVEILKKAGIHGDISR